MRALEARKLIALGYTIGPKLNVRGLEATCIKTQRGDCLLLLSHVFYGPSWAQIYKCFEHLVPTAQVITLGSNPAVLISDTAESRTLITNLLANANASRGKQVHLEDAGFVELQDKPRPDLKNLALPVVSIVCVVGLGIFWSISEQSIREPEVTKSDTACAVDLNTSDFEILLLEALKGETELSPDNQIQKSTPLAQLNIVVQSTIGSAAKVTGTAVCTDGRQRAINHRVDISGSGAALELGQ